MSTPPPAPPPTRKVPPPCWTHDETLALIDAYRDRWLALRRGYLRSSDWEAVSTAVSGQCAHVLPPKTSAQCRHKIEKLRQRYRAEKQRSLSFPGKFFSSWVFFNNLDFIDEGSTSTVGSNQANSQVIHPGGGFRLKSVRLGSKSDGVSNPNVDLDEDDDDEGFVLKNPISGGRNSFHPGFIGSKNYKRIDGNSKKRPDFGHDFDVGGGFPLKSFGDRSSVPPRFRSQNYSKIDANSDSNLDFDHEFDDGIESSAGIRKRTLRDWDPSRFKSKNYNGNSDLDQDDDYDVEDGMNSGGGFHRKTQGEWRSVPSGFRPKNYSNMDGNSNSSILNGCSSSSRLKFVKKSNGERVKRESDPVGELVSSIKFLGDWFVKMEKMKMETAREIEKMRMDMELKRNEMLLESQRQIVDAFVNGFLEKKKKKVNIMVSPDS